MAIVPDLSAIRAVKKRSKKLKTVTPKNYISCDPNKNSQHISQKHQEQDREALKALRQEGIRSLLDQLVEQGYDEPDVILGDTQLLHDWRVQNIKAALEETAGEALEDAVKSLPSHLPHQDSLLDQVADSDGDLDLSHMESLMDEGVPKRNQEEKTTQVIYRDRDGFKITKEKWLEYQRHNKGGYRPKRSSPPPAVKQPPVEWGAGLHQLEERQERLKEEQRLAAKPLTEYEIDSVADQSLKEKIHWADPLREMAQSLHHRDEHGLPKCRFPTPPNRFNILAGYRWDGVIRGNGFEQRLLKERNKLKHQTVEAYKWSIEDV